jgi:hypothetical protein
LKVKLRVARPTNDLVKLSEMYRKGLGLEILGSFQNHEGFDGVMLGMPQGSYHLEFTQEIGHQAPRSLSEENLLVFYIPDATEWKAACDRMLDAGFLSVKSHNPYWDKNGQTFEDVDGYRVVLAKQAWAK